MTNHEALLRLSVDKNDHLAVTSLHENNAEIIRTTVMRYFGSGTAAENVEFELMKRMAGHARLYEDSEDLDVWLAEHGYLPPSFRAKRYRIEIDKRAFPPPAGNPFRNRILRSQAVEALIEQSGKDGERLKKDLQSTFGLEIPAKSRS